MMKTHHLEKRYVNLLQEYNRQQWFNYVRGANNDLNKLDSHIYMFLRRYRDFDQFNVRKLSIWKKIVFRGMIDKHPAVARLMNKLDLGNRRVYRWSETDTQLQVAERMRKDVVQLMKLRNQLSHSLGFDSYVDLVFFSEGLDKNRVFKILQDFVDTHLFEVRSIISEQCLSWDNWFSDIRELGEPPEFRDVEELKTDLIYAFGLLRFNDRISVVSSEHGFGFCRPLSIPDDVRVFVNSRPSIQQVRTIFHEVGHALGHAVNSELGLYKTYSLAHDEIAAVIGEMLGAKILTDPSVCQYLHKITLLENVRCAIKSLFELQVWKDPDQAENLYEKYFSSLGYNIEYPELWALDTFMSLDPIYNHNYVLGFVVADRIGQYLQAKYADQHELWGDWLVANYFRLGRSRSLSAKLEGIIDL